jgi:arylsulfatase A-like enzyme
MSSTRTSPYSRMDFLTVVIWWGLLTGLGEGLSSYYSHSPVWHDQMRAAIIVDPLLFLGVGLLIVVLNRSLVVTRGLLFRVTLGCSFLALYDWFGGLIPRLFDILPFLATLAGASLIAWFCFLWRDYVFRFFRRSLPILSAIALLCIVIFPINQQRQETHELARLSSPANAQNVLVVVVDSLRADHLSTYGYSRPTSPNISRVANEGMLFENAVAASSWTLPSHASILTGLYPHDHHADGEGANFGQGYPTIAEALKSLGYRTAAFSANTGTFSRERGFGRGFIHFEDDFQTWGSTLGQTFYGGKIANRLCQFHVTRDLLGRLSAADITAHALHWIDSDRRPFFVFLNYYDLHDPYLPPDPYLHKYTKVKHPGGRFTLHWEWFENLTPEERAAAMAAYDGAINYVDIEIANLMQELKHRGLAENTLVIITSDHGEAFYEHGLMNHGNSLYRELIHVPLILWEPGMIPAGKRISDPVSLNSLPATVLDLFGDNSQQQFPGASLRELWTEGARPGEFSPPISEVAQMKWNPKYPNYYGPLESVTTSQWHYITGGNTGEQLFRCCDASPERPNLATTADGTRMCELFRKELRMTARMGSEEKEPPVGMAVKHGSP